MFSCRAKLLAITSWAAVLLSSPFPVFAAADSFGVSAGLRVHELRRGATAFDDDASSFRHALTANVVIGHDTPFETHLSAVATRRRDWRLDHWLLTYEGLKLKGDSGHLGLIFGARHPYRWHENGGFAFNTTRFLSGLEAGQRWGELGATARFLVFSPYRGEQHPVDSLQIIYDPSAFYTARIAASYALPWGLAFDFALGQTAFRDAGIRSGMLETAIHHRAISFASLGARFAVVPALSLEAGLERALTAVDQRSLYYLTGSRFLSGTRDQVFLGVAYAP